MTAPSFLELVAQRVVVYDGATGTWLQTQGLTADDYGSEALEGCTDLLEGGPGLRQGVAADGEQCDRQGDHDGDDGQSCDQAGEPGPEGHRCTPSSARVMVACAWPVTVTRLIPMMFRNLVL